MIKYIPIDEKFKNSNELQTFIKFIDDEVILGVKDIYEREYHILALTTGGYLQMIDNQLPNDLGLSVSEGELKILSPEYYQYS